MNKTAESAEIYKKGGSKNDDLFRSPKRLACIAWGNEPSSGIQMD